LKDEVTDAYFLLSNLQVRVIISRYYDVFPSETVIDYGKKQPFIATSFHSVRDKEYFELTLFFGGKNSFPFLSEILLLLEKYLYAH